MGHNRLLVHYTCIQNNVIIIHTLRKLFELHKIFVQVGRLYPQAVYFPIRTLYLTLKIEQRERHKSAENTTGHVPHQVTAAAVSVETNNLFTLR